MTTRIVAIVLFAVLFVWAIAQQTGIIKAIDVKGNKEIGTAGILATMRSKVGQPFTQATLDSDKKALDDLGWFSNVDVRAAAIEGDNWNILVEVQEWPVVKEIRIVGNTIVSTEELRQLLQVQPGKVFNMRDAVQSSRKIEDLYTKRGYFARVSEFQPMRESPNTVSLVVQEMTIGSVSVQGNLRTKTSVIRKLIKSKAGEAYNPHKWELDLRRLYGTQWFENVKSLEEQPEPGKVNLIADVKETRTGQFNVGLQLDPRSSLAGIIKLQDTNFRGSGQGVGIDFTQATRGGGPSVELFYSNPFVDSHMTSISASVYSRLLYRFSGNALGGNTVPTPDSQYTERRTGASLGLARPLDDYSSLGINGRLENIDTNNLTTTNQNGFIQQDGSVGVFTLGYTRNRRDVDIDPSRGYWLRTQIEPGFSHITKTAGAIADPSILGTHMFTKANLEYRQYLTDQKPRTLKNLDEPRRVLALRAIYGTISGKTPFFEQYFVGGSDTLRGYAEDRFWGNHQFLSTAELRIPVQKAFNIIGFVDYGGAWGGYGSVNSFTQSSKMKLHLGYGIGFSFRTPLGPLRLDLGFDEKGKSRTHFLIGTSF